MLILVYLGPGGKPPLGVFTGGDDAAAAKLAEKYPQFIYFLVSGEQAL